jgi:hypothetical protein
VKIPCFRSTAVAMAVAMFALGSGRAEASLAPAMMPPAAVDRTQDLQKVQRFLEQKEVAQRLEHMKLSAPEVESRLSNLSDQELHQVASKIDRQNPGADAGGVAVTVLVIGILALLFVYLLKRV